MRDSEDIYDHFLIVGSNSKTLARHSPRIILHHALPSAQPLNVHALADFCMPAGALVTRQRKKDVEEAVFVLSDGARVRYCFCLHFLVSDGELRVDRCYCLVTRHPFARLHFQVLRNANVEQLIDSYAKVSVPDPGDCIVLADLVEWRRPLRNAPPLATVRDWALPKMFAHLTLENLLLVLGCALVELQIIFVSDKHEALSASTLGLASMLAPLNWAGPLISTLPSKMYEYLESPVPSVVGVLSLPCNFRQGCDMVVVFLEQDKVSLPPNIHSRPDSHLSIQLPRLSQLAHDLHSDYKAFRDSSSSSSPYQQPSLEPMTDTSPATDIPNDGSTASSFGSGDNSLQFPLDGDNDITESRPRDAAAFIPQREKKGVAIPPPSSLVNVVANRIEHHLRALVATASELRNEKDAGDSLLSTRGSAQTAFDRPQSADTPPRQTLCDVAPGRCLSPSKLARKECWYNNLGDTCLSYIAKFAETQMFTNYFWSRQRNGVSASKLIAKRTQELMSLMLRGGAYFPVIASIYDTASSSPTEKDLLFCNGRCGGRLNTANCTLLCARLWEERQISNKKPWRKKMPSLSRHPLETRDQLLLRQKLHHRCQISPAKDALRSKRRGLNKSTRVGHGEKIALRHMRRAAEKARARKDRRNAAAALIAVAWTMYNRIRRNYAAVSIQRVARRLKPVLLSCPRPKIERSEELVRGTTNEENLFDGDTKVEIVSNGNTERGMASTPPLGNCRTSIPAEEYTRSETSSAQQASARQQTTAYSDIEFRRALRAGIVCTKHSRYGKPHKRVIQCNSDFTEIQWRAEESKTLSMAALRKRTLASIRSILRFREKNRRFRMSQVLEICENASTPNAKRAVKNNSFTSPHARILSLVYGDKNSRSLDLEFGTLNQHNTILRGLHNLSST